MNELRKFLFGQRGAVRIKPFCQKCVESVSFREGLRFSHKTQQFFSQTQNVNSRLKSTVRNVCEKLDILSELLFKQCNVVVAQRIRRSYQMLQLYRNLYGEHALKEKMCIHFNKIRKKPLVALLSAAIFNWESERVTDQEIKRCLIEVDEVNRLVRDNQILCKNDQTQIQPIDWEQIVDKEDFKVWRHQLPDSNLYQYRVLGNFKDIPARAFFNTQIDVHYWKDWDTQTMDVSVVDRDSNTGSEVIYWLYKFPYPMFPREYVYVRRYMIDSETKSMIITARATEHPRYPHTNSSVRVETYNSQMVIKPYTSFDENGFAYVMSYCDDPKTSFPPMCYNWIASAGVHEFLERMHKAALKKHEKSVDYSSGEFNANPSFYSGMVQ